MRTEDEFDTNSSRDGFDTESDLNYSTCQSPFILARNDLSLQNLVSQE